MAEAGLIATLKTILHYKSFLLGLAILLLFIGLSIYAAVTWPYNVAVSMWNDLKVWEDNPRLAKPAWVTIFTGKKELEGSIIMYERIKISESGRGYNEYNVSYEYDEFPSRVTYRLTINTSGNVMVRIKWIKPNGISIPLISGFYSNGSFLGLIDITPGEVQKHVLEYVDIINELYSVKLEAQKLDPVKILFADDDYLVKGDVYSAYRVLKGIYRVGVEVWGNPGDIVDLKIVIYGTIYGVAGTDRYGRDLFMGIAWGAPMAIIFGLSISILSTILGLVVAAISAWFGGMTDIALMRINEIVMILPFLPLIMTIYLFYGFTLWQMLWIIVLLSVLGGLKGSRAMFLQIKEAPYIEAARAYGASSWRIIFKYMVPRVLPLMIPGLITAVPGFVFLEAALAVIGIADPRTITWGKILNEAYGSAALLQGYYHWILAPLVSLFMLSIAFAAIGFTLDRVFNPKLKEM